MSEAVWIALIVAGTSLFTQLMISWVQPSIKARFERKKHRRDEICKCFSELFGLLGAPPAAKNVSAITQKDRDEYDRTATDKWFFKFNAILWELNMHLGEESPILYNKLQELSNCLADIYELQSSYLLFDYAEKDNDSKRIEISDSILQKQDAYQKLSEEFTTLSTEYARKL